MPNEPLAQAIKPQWAAPARVGALMSTRHGGVSMPPFVSLNLGLGSGDAPSAVASNRARFAAALGAQPFWLRQVHGATVVQASRAGLGLPAPQADASFTAEPGVACTVLVADCLPVLFAAANGRAVAAAHAGWRGLAAGVLQASLERVCAAAGCAPVEVAVWLGACIGPRQFEVGADVLAAFAPLTDEHLAALFTPCPRADGAMRWLADLPGLARRVLRQAGVTDVASLDACTVEQPDSYFSYRRDGASGRMAAAVWLQT